MKTDWKVVPNNKPFDKGGISFRFSRCGVIVGAPGVWLVQNEKI